MNDKFKFHIVPSRGAMVPEDKEEKFSGKQYMYYGEDNQYPLFLSNLLDKSTTLGTCISGLSDYVYAHGIEDSELGERVINKNGETFNEVLHKLVIDYISYGAFCMQVIGNDFGEPLHIYYLDVRKVRLSEDGKKVYFSKKAFGKYSKVDAVYDRFNGMKMKNAVMYFKRPTSKTFYGRPMWHSSLKSVMTDVEIANYHYSSIVNNFAPSAIVNFNNGMPSEDIQDEIERKLTDKFAGSENAARLLVSFNDDKEHATEIERFSEDNFDTKYEALSKNVRDNILASFRASGALFGIMPEQTGFNSVEYQSAYTLYKQTVVVPIQQEIEAAFKKIGINIKFTEFVVDFGDTEENVL